MWINPQTLKELTTCNFFNYRCCILPSRVVAGRFLWAEGYRSIVLTVDLQFTG